MSSVLNFVRLPHVLILLWAVLRLGVSQFGGMDYAPRGSGFFSLVWLTTISCLFWGALSVSVKKYDWKGTLLSGALIALWAQILIFVFTIFSFAAGWSNSFYIHPDALNLPPGEAVTWSVIFSGRFVGMIINVTIGAIVAAIGRMLAKWAPTPA